MPRQCGARQNVEAPVAMHDAYAGCINDPTNLPLYYTAELQPQLLPANTPPDVAETVNTYGPCFRLV